MTKVDRGPDELLQHPASDTQQVPQAQVAGIADQAAVQADGDVQRAKLQAASAVAGDLLLAAQPVALGVAVADWCAHMARFGNIIVRRKSRKRGRTHRTAARRARERGREDRGGLESEGDGV